MALLIYARPDISPMVFFSLSDNLNVIYKHFLPGKGFLFFLNIGELVDLMRTGAGEEIQKGRTRNTMSAGCKRS